MLLLIALFLFFRVAAAYFLVQRAKKFYWSLGCLMFDYDKE
jgi:hypothetical protein